MSMIIVFPNTSNRTDTPPFPPVGIPPQYSETCVRVTRSKTNGMSLPLRTWQHLTFFLFCLFVYSFVVVYGVTTGFGKFASVVIPRDKLK